MESGIRLLAFKMDNLEGNTAALLPLIGDTGCPLYGSESTFNYDKIDFDIKLNYDDYGKYDRINYDMKLTGASNRNTANKTRRDLAIVRKFIASKADYRNIETIPSLELNSYLSELVLVIRRKDGKDFEPSSIRGILASVERYLRQWGTGISVFKDPVFRQTREAMREKCRQLARDGKGNKVGTAIALTEEEIDVLYMKGLLGPSTAESLINTLWLNNCRHFGLKGCIRNRNMKWGDVSLLVDEMGYEYLEYDDNHAKMQTGMSMTHVVTMETKPRMYGIPGSTRDPIFIYKIYASKRPIIAPDSPFYLAVNLRTSGKKNNATWFKASPMGVNKINSLAKTMLLKGGLDDLTGGSQKRQQRRRRLIQMTSFQNGAVNCDAVQSTLNAEPVNIDGDCEQFFDMDLLAISNVDSGMIPDICDNDVFPSELMSQQNEQFDQQINDLLEHDDITSYFDPVYLNGSFSPETSM